MRNERIVFAGATVSIVLASACGEGLWRGAPISPANMPPDPVAQRPVLMPSAKERTLDYILSIGKVRQMKDLESDAQEAAESLEGNISPVVMAARVGILTGKLEAFGPPDLGDKNLADRRLLGLRKISRNLFVAYCETLKMGLLERGADFLASVEEKMAHLEQNGYSRFSRKGHLVEDIPDCLLRY